MCCYYIPAARVLGLRLSVPFYIPAAQLLRLLMPVYFLVPGARALRLLVAFSGLVTAAQLLLRRLAFYRFDVLSDASLQADRQQLLGFHCKLHGQL